MTPPYRGLWVVLLATLACAEPEPSEGDGLVRITVAEEPARVSDADLARVDDVLVDGDGRVWILTPYAPLVRVYDREGARLGAFGATGGGPEEFGAAKALVAGGAEGVGVMDVVRRGVRYFDLDGSVRTERPVPGSPQFPPDTRRAFFGDLGWTWQVDGGYLQDRYPEGVRLALSQPFDFWVADLVMIPHDGSEPRTLLTFSDFVVLPDPLEPAPRMLSAGPLWDLCPDGDFVFRTGASSELVRVGMDGGVRARHRVEMPLAPVDRDLMAEWLYQTVVRLDTRPPGDIRASAAALAERAEPYLEATAPPTRLRCDASGRIWIQLFDVEDDPRGYAREWVVVSRDGVVLAEVTFPPGFHPMRFTEDRAVGILRDELDVETVAWVGLPEITPP